ncbi:MAG: calcium/sodium antiporter [Aggregatilineales bacterium]
MDPIDIIRVLIGLVGLYYGGDFLVQGASHIAKSFGISSLIIGLTIVALGTSAPELLVSVTSALQGESDLALGNVIGSNIANIGLILGIVGLITPIFVDKQLVRREIPIMIGVTLFATLLIFDGELNQLDGMILLFAFGAFNLLFYYIAQKEHDVHEAEEAADPNHHESDEEEYNIPREAMRVVFGVFLLVIGANLMVEGAVNIATALNVPELVIGITMVAFGTSLPELATSITAALNGENDIAVGNVIGSNVANLLMVLGATALVNPIDVGANILSVVEFPIMIGFSLLLYPFARNQVLSRRESAIFLGAYFSFILYSFLGR